MTPAPDAQDASTAHAERGSAIIVSMLLLTLFLMLGGAFLSTSLSDSLIVGNQVAATRAFHLAEAGLTHARATIDSAAIDAALAGDGWLLYDEPLGTGSYSVRVTNNTAPTFPLAGVEPDPGGATTDTDGYVVLTATGAFRRAARTLRLVVREDSRPWDGWGLFGTDRVSATGTGTLSGRVGTNHDITLGSDLLGDAIAGGVVSDHSRVSGTIVEHAPRVRFSGTACPTGAYGPAPSGPGVTFDPVRGDLTISGSADVVIPGGTYYFHKVVKSGSGKLIVRAGETVEMYVKSDMQLEGSAFDTRSGSPEELLLLGCSENAGIGAAAPEWRIAPDHTMYVTIYAPTHQLRLYGDGDKIGTFVGKSLRKIGRGNVVQLNGSSGSSSSGTRRVVPGTWSER